MEPGSIVRKVADAGVCGAGGGGFPTHVKLSAKAEAVIANGAECEPILSTDRHLMETRAGEIVEALRIARAATGAGSAYIALKGKYSEAVKSIKRAAGESSDVKVLILEDYYPAGDEFELVYRALGRIIPEGGIPLDSGAVVLNVNTLLNIFRAVKESAPVTGRWVTVAGEVKEPYMAEVPLGTAASELIKAARPLIEDYAVISGGPMTGVIRDEDFLIDKVTGGVLLLPEDHPVVVKKRLTPEASERRGRSVCDQCFDCTVLCPRYLLGHLLEPHRIMRSLFVGDEHPKEHMSNSCLCCECELCTMYACPLDLSPSGIIRGIKRTLSEKGVKNPHRSSELETHPERGFRRVSSERLTARLDIGKYDNPALPVRDVEVSSVAIPLKQHAGLAARPVVEPGREVNEGDLIADIPEGELGSAVHASIAGKVTSVDSDFIFLGG